MSRRRCIVPDTGVPALLLAAHLSERGHEVVLLRSVSADARAGSAAPLGVRFGRAGRLREVAFASATDDPFEALAAGEVIVVAAASMAGREAFTDLVLPLVEPRHVVVFVPGSFRSLECVAWLTGRGRADLPTLVEVDCAPVAGLGRGDRVLEVLSDASRPGLGVFPSARTDASWPLLADLFPAAHLHPHVVAAALADPLPMLHATARLLNRRDAQGSRSLPELFCADVARVAARVDEERLALGSAMGLDLTPAAQALHRFGLSPLGDLWAAVHGSRALVEDTRVDEPEEAATALRPFVGLAVLLAVAVPVTRALLALADTLADEDDLPWTFDELGLRDAGLGTLLRFLETGEAKAAPPRGG